MSATIQRKSQQLDINIDTDSTFREKLTWKTGDRGSEVPVDLTGFSAAFQIWDEVDGTLLHEATTANGDVELGGINGEIDVTISHADLQSFTWSKAVYGLQFTLPNSDKQLLTRGVITLFNEASI